MTLKVPHAVTLHAVQVLPALALLLIASDTAERRRVRIVQLGATGHPTVIASTLLQTYTGRAPLYLTLASSALAALGLALLVASGVLALLALAPRFRGARPTPQLGRPRPLLDQIRRVRAERADAKTRLGDLRPFTGPLEARMLSLGACPAARDRGRLSTHRRTRERRSS